MTQLQNLIGARLDVMKYLRAHGFNAKVEGVESDGRMKYILDHCPFDPSHKGKDAVIFQDPQGKLGAKCFHASCAGRGWAEFRNAIGPIRMEHMSGGGPSRFKAGLPGMPARRTEGPPFDLEVMTNAELDADDTKLEFLVDQVLVAQQPCTLGGSSKTLKTSLAVDLAVSVASGKPWLGTFAVAGEAPVFVVSAESGKPVLRDLMQTVCRVKGVNAKDQPIHWSFRRPQLANLAHLNVLTSTLEAIKPKLVILDPSYLLISGAGSDSTKNLFAMGEVLGGIADAVSGACGGTLVLLHHVNKGASKSVKGVMPLITLSDLAYAGFVEWTRQWLLVSRVTAYEEGTGQHNLHLSAGGSAGHSGAWSVVIDEGRPMKGDRRWEVQVGEELAALQPGRSDGELGRVISAINVGGALSIDDISSNTGMSKYKVKKALADLVIANEVWCENGLYRKTEVGG